MAREALTVHEQARIVVAAGDRSVNRSTLARELGISRQWLSTLIGRFRAEELAGFEPRSRAPVSPAQCDAGVEDAVVRTRKQLVEDGFGFGPGPIRWELQRQGVSPLPSEATIWRMCVRRGLVVPEPKKRPKSSWGRFEFAAPNECWQIDFTHWQLRDDSPVIVMNVIDDHSRVCVASIAARRSSSRLAWQAFSAGAQRWGPPAMVLSDNGLEFSNRRSVTGHRFVDNLHAVGVKTINSRPFHPQTCGKVERLHQTLKQWLRARPAPRTITQLQALLDTFTERYNFDRPHRSIDRNTPAQRWHASPAAGPGDPTTSRDERVATLHANRVGRIDLSPWQIALGVRYAHQTVTVFVDDLDVTVFTTSGQLVRSLQIDPTRRYQRASNT
jgi:transposase InsO family protein